MFCNPPNNFWSCHVKMQTTFSILFNSFCLSTSLYAKRIFPKLQNEYDNISKGNELFSTAFYKYHKI